MKSRNQGVTGHDSYIFIQALAYSSEWLRSLGLPYDEPSNRHDMDLLLGRSSFASLMRHQARNNLRRRTIKSAEEWQAVMLQDAKETEEYLAAEDAEWSEVTIEDLDVDNHCVEETV